MKVGRARPRELFRLDPAIVGVIPLDEPVLPFGAVLETREIGREDVIAQGVLAGLAQPGRQRVLQLSGGAQEGAGDGDLGGEVVIQEELLVR